MRSHLGKGPQLCDSCKELPFSQCFSAESSGLAAGSRLVYFVELQKILKRKETCPFCKLLIDSCTQAEHDLFKSEYIAEHIRHDERFQQCLHKAKGSKPNDDRLRFEHWVAHNLAGIGKLAKDDLWPFGYTHRQEEVDATRDQAEQLFAKAEKSDLIASASSPPPSQGEIFDVAGVSEALRVAQLNLGMAQLSVGDNHKALAIAQLATGQIGMFAARGSEKKLPCWFALQFYPRIGGNNPANGKSSAISVRVYAHSNGPRGPLREISHFTFRSRHSTDLQSVGEQMWYGRQLQRRIDVPFFRVCLRECVQRHGGRCSLPAVKTLSTDKKGFSFRLIDINRGCVVETNTPTAPAGTQGSFEYATLSYVWGDERANSGGTCPHRPSNGAESLTELTVANRLELLLPGSLNRKKRPIPLTIRDAVDVARGVQVPYLWVDRFCIIQDDAEDKEENLRRMDRIYAGATLTIANSERSADTGILGVNTDRDLEPACVGKIPPDVSLFLPMQASHDLRPWVERAWTLQEQVLSGRLLIFSRGKAVWHCRGAKWREDVNALDVETLQPRLQLPRMEPTKPDAVHPGIRKMQLDSSSRLFWTSHFKNYAGAAEAFSRRVTARHESEEQGCLDAFQGLESVFDHVMGGQGLRMGLPLAYMDTALLWQPRGPMLRRTGAERSPPSWSWAGWKAVSLGSESSGVYYEPTFDVQADEVGILMRMKAHNQDGEERIRPFRNSIHVWRQVMGYYKTKEVGLWRSSTQHREQTGWGARFDNALWVPRLMAIYKTQKYLDFQKLRDKLVHEEVQKLSESQNRELSSDPEVHAEFERKLNVRLHGQLYRQLEKQLLIRTEAACLYLDKPVIIARSHSEISGITFCRETWFPYSGSLHDCGERVTQSVGHPIKDPVAGSSLGASHVGCVKMLVDGEQLIVGAHKVEAIILSEAQYMGNEKSIDFQGYPLYNVMIIHTKKVIEQGRVRVAERIGLGKMYKYAWESAKPADEVIVLE